MTDWSNQMTLSEGAGPVIEAYVDGSCLNNGDPDAVAGVGCIIKFGGGRDSTEFSCQPDVDERITSIIAEYLAVMAALVRIKDEHSNDVVLHIYNDCETVVRQLQGDYCVHKDHLEKARRETLDFLNEFRSWQIEQHSESRASEIRRADELATEASKGGSS